MGHQQMTLFGEMYEKYTIKKPIKLITLFSGIGAQEKALELLGANFEIHKTCEWAVPSIKAYKAIHSSFLKKYDFSQFEWPKFDKTTRVQMLEGISANYNEPMKAAQIAKKSDEWINSLIEDIVETNNVVNIMDADADAFEVFNSDKYTYVAVYSFPCQDLSLAGNKRGMSVSQKDGGTRSGLLWEVERIIDELAGRKTLPEVLIMENVPEVINQKNIKDFQKWEMKLESLGYSNYIDILNAKDYGIPQNRRRCFMVSVLGKYSFAFPMKMNLKYKLSDFLESHVNEKYYLSKKMIDYITAKNDKWTGNNNGAIVNREIAVTINTAPGQRRCDASDYIAEGLPENTDLRKLESLPLKEQLCVDLIASGAVKENDVIRHSYTKSRLKGEMKDIKENNVSPTLDTRCDCLGVVVKEGDGLRLFQSEDWGEVKVYDQVSPTIKAGKVDCGVAIKNATKQGYLEAEEGDGIDISTRMHHHRGTVQKGISQTLTTMGGENVGTIQNLRIRKLTPLECLKLMGFQEKDYKALVEAGQTNSQIYHEAGDSIVVTVLMAIFGELLDIDYEPIIKDYVDSLKSSACENKCKMQ